MVALLEIDRGSRLRLDFLVFSSPSLSRVFVPAIGCVWRRHFDFLEREQKTGHNSFIGHWRAFERLRSTIIVITILITSSRSTRLYLTQKSLGCGILSFNFCVSVELLFRTWASRPTTISRLLKYRWTNVCDWLFASWCGRWIDYLSPEVTYKRTSVVIQLN